METRKYSLLCSRMFNLFIAFIVFSMGISCNQTLDLSDVKTVTGGSGDQGKTLTDPEQADPDSGTNDDDDDDDDAVATTDDDDDDNDTEDVNIDITTKYKFKNSWYDSRIGKYEKITDLTMKVGNNKIDSTYKRTSIECVSGCAHVDEVKAKVSSEDKTSYTRTTLSKLKKQSSKDYEEGLNVLLFVDKAKQSDNFGNSYSYSFSKPVPIYPKDNLTSYDQYDGKVYSYTYKVKDDYIFKKELEATMEVSISVVSSEEVTIKFTHTFNGVTDLKKVADLYSRYPVLKTAQYRINVSKRNVMTVSGEGRTLVVPNGSSRYGADGWVSTVNISGNICSYRNGDSKTKKYDCN